MGRGGGVRVLFDIETNGLLDSLDRIHCIAAYDLDSGAIKLFEPDEISEGVAYLSKASLLSGHNILSFDLPAVEKVTGIKLHGELFDTKLMAQLAFSDVKSRDMARHAQWKALAATHGADAVPPAPLPTRLIGRHSLEAWGHRLGEFKGNFSSTTDWSQYTPDMGEYCLQDVMVNVHLYNALRACNLDSRAVHLEHDFAAIMFHQEKSGFRFDLKNAEGLLGVLLQEQAKLRQELTKLFPPKEVEYFTKVKRIRKVKTVHFNPGSRQQIAAALKEKYGWVATPTKGGSPQVNEEVLRSLDYPEAQHLAHYFMIQKRLGMLAEGRNAWLKRVKGDGRIHGGVIATGTPHGRCAHVSPNMAQVPGVCGTCGHTPCRVAGGGRAHTPYGLECRSLFTVEDGNVLVGADGAGFQLRNLAHYLAPYDAGEYINVVTTGDPHSKNQEAMGLDTRSMAKTKMYAFLFGAGPTHLGDGDPDAGKLLISNMFNRLQGLGDLMWDLNNRVAYPHFRESSRNVSKEDYIASFSGGQYVGWRRKKNAAIRGLDGRRIPIPSSHVVLNYLLAGAEAVLMKQATVNFDFVAGKRGLVRGDGPPSSTTAHGYCHVAHVHDEFQIEARERYGDDVGETMVTSIKKAGRDFKFRCPLDGEYKIGKTWAETH